MPTMDKLYIEERVQEWINRINALYAFVEQDLTELGTIKCAHTRQITMNEELMQQFSVSPRQLPILDIYKNNKIIASFKPVGLWVIGANGRIDILTEKGAYILVDKAEYSHPSKWVVFLPHNKRFDSQFTSSFIIKLARQA